MKLISWNVNGLRACVGKGFFEFLAQEQPDMMCLQETKLQPEQAPAVEGYFEYWYSAKKRDILVLRFFQRKSHCQFPEDWALRSTTMKGVSSRQNMRTFIWLRSMCPIRRTSSSVWTIA